MSWGFFEHFDFCLQLAKLRYSLRYKIILEREERNQLNSLKEQLVICSRRISETKIRELEKEVSIFQVTFNPLCLRPEALIDSFVALGVIINYKTRQSCFVSVDSCFWVLK